MNVTMLRPAAAALLTAMPKDRTRENHASPLARRRSGMKLARFTVGAAGLVSMVALAVPRMAAMTAETTLPPAARAAFQHGIEAVQAHDWTLASQYFGEARKAAPGSPIVALNLGLAFAKARQEPMAITWLTAFVEADPDSSEAAAARQEISRLKTEARNRLKLLEQTALTAIQQSEGSDHSGALTALARSLAAAGLLDDALAILAQHDQWQDDFYKKRATTETMAEVLSSYAETVCEAGDPSRAADALMRIEATGVDLAAFVGYDHSWERVSEAFVNRKDFARAWRAAKQIPAAEERGRQMASVAKLRLEEGDLIPAEQALTLLKDPWRSWLVQNMVESTVKQREFRRAKQLAADIRERTYLRAESLVVIAKKQFEAGDVAGARATAREVLDLGPAQDIERDFDATSGISIESAFQASLLLGDYASALQFALRQKDNPYGKFYEPYDSVAELVYWQAVNGRDLASATRTARKILDRPSTSDPAKLAVAAATIHGALMAAQIKLGHFREGLATARLPVTRRDRIGWRIAGCVTELAEAGQIQAAAELASALRDSGNEGEEHSSLERYRAIAGAGLARAQVKNGQLAAAEQLAASIPDPQYRPLVWIAIADGHVARGAKDEAVRALDSAARAAAAMNDGETCDLRGLSDWWWGDKRWYENPWGVTRKELTLRTAELQSGLGDTAAAEATRARWRPAVGGAWIKLADDYSFQRETAAVDRTLEEARTSKSPSEIVSKLEAAIEAYGKNLVRVDVLEANQAQARESGSAQP